MKKNEKKIKTYKFKEGKERRKRKERREEASKQILESQKQEENDLSKK